jgi:hypothetical protein
MLILVRMKNIRGNLCKLVKHRLVIFVILTFKLSISYSQVSIIGSVKDTDGDTIEFATVQLLFDAKHHQSALSDSMGNYSIEATQEGDCELVARMIGYVPAGLQLNLKNDTIIHFVLQPDTIALNEITVLGHKKLIQAMPDRHIINIKGNIETTGKETSDLLKQLPGIYASDESINISGKSSVLVYINDREVRLGGRTLISYLNSLPPNIVKTVEIISTPPAQYDAEGNVGIIKINTDKNILPGWKANFRAGYIRNTFSSYMLSAYLNYSGEKLFFEANLSNGSYTNLNRSSYRSEFPDQTTTTYNPKRWNSSSAQLQTSLGYNFNENSTIIFDLQAPLFNKETIEDIENYTRFINPISQHSDSTIFSDGRTIKDLKTYNTEVFFKHLFADKQSFFTASAAYLNHHSSNSRDFISITQIENLDRTTENYFTQGNQNYSIVTSKLDFSFPLISWKVTTGLKLSFINTISDNQFFTVLNGIHNLEQSLYNEFDYSENVQSVYYSMEKYISNWAVKGGLRSELTNTLSKSLVDNKSHKNRYIRFFPSLFLSHNFTNGSSLALSYTNRLERPPYQFLDPFKWYISKYDYAVGNPFLEPSKIMNIELTYMINSTFSAKLYYTGHAGKIGQYVVLDSLNILNQIQQADNFLNESRYGLYVYKYLRMSDWLETVIHGELYCSEFVSERESFADLNGIGSTIVMSNTIALHKNFRIVLNMEDRIPGLYNYRTMKNYFRLDFGLNYVNEKKHFEVRLLVGDVLKTANPEYHYNSGGVKQVYNNYHDSRFMRLIVSWRPGNWFNTSPQTAVPSNIDEKQRIIY